MNGGMPCRFFVHCMLDLLSVCSIFVAKTKHGNTSEIDKNQLTVYVEVFCKIIQIFEESRSSQ